MAMRNLSTDNTTVALWQALDYSSRKMLLRLMSISYGGAAPATSVLDFYEDGAPEFTPSADLAECTPDDGSASDGSDGEPDDEDSGPVAAIVRSEVFKGLLDQWHTSENTGQAFQLGSVQPAQLMWLVGQVTALDEEERDMLLQYVPAEVASIMRAFGLAPAPAAEEALEEGDAQDTPLSTATSNAASASQATPAVMPALGSGGVMSMLAGFASMASTAPQPAAKTTADTPTAPSVAHAGGERPHTATPQSTAASAGGGSSPLPLPTHSSGPSLVDSSADESASTCSDNIPVDFHSEADFPAERVSVLAPRLRDVVQRGLMQVIQKEVVNHLTQSRSTFLHVVLGKHRLQIKKPPLIVRQALNQELTAQLAAAGVDMDSERRAP